MLIYILSYQNVWEQLIELFCQLNSFLYTRTFIISINKRIRNITVIEKISGYTYTYYTYKLFIFL